MDTLAEHTTEGRAARELLLAELREHALILGEVTLTSGAKADYYVDAKRAILRPAGFGALARLVAAQAHDWEATAVGGMTMGADPVACAALAGGAQAKVFFVRKEAKAHGLQRRIEGPPLDPQDRCMVVEDVVTTGGSTLAAIQALQAAGHTICGVVSVLDRLAGGGEAIARASGAPYVALTTIDEVHPSVRTASVAEDADEAPLDQPVVRAATEGDVALLLELFAELADYEQLTGELRGTEAQLSVALFGPQPAAEALIAERGGEVAGYAVFYPTFSSFLARTGVWLEDLYVRPAHRGGGVGHALLTAVAARTCERGGERLEWMALDWNELALGFYSHLGAEQIGEWIPHRVTGDALAALAHESAVGTLARRR